MNKSVDDLVKKIAAKAKTEEMFDIYELYQELSMDVIGRTAFGIEMEGEAPKNNPFLVNAKGIFSISLTSPTLVIQSNFLFPPFLF